MMPKGYWPFMAIVWFGVIGFFSVAAMSAEQRKPATSPTSGQIHQSGLSGTPPPRMPDLELTSIWVNEDCLPRVKVTNTGETVIKSDVNCKLQYLVDGEIFAVSSCTYKDLNPEGGPGGYLRPAELPSSANAKK